MRSKENVSAVCRAERMQACEMWKVAFEPDTQKGNNHQISNKCPRVICVIGYCIDMMLNEAEESF